VDPCDIYSYIDGGFNITYMKILLVSNTEFRKRPHLVRLVNLLVSRGIDVSFLGVGKDNIASEGINNIQHLKVSGDRLNLLFIPLIQANIITRAKKLDIIIATHPYSLLSSTLSRIFQGQAVPICYYPGEIYDGSGLWHLRLIEKMCFSSVKSIISPNIPRLDYLVQRFGDRPYFILPNSTPDMSEFSNYVPASSDREMRLIYLGTSNVIRRCLDTLIMAVDKANFNVSLMIAVGGREENINEIKGLISNTVNQDRFEFLDYVQYPRHFDYMKSADVGVMLYHPDISLNYKFCEPNKLYEYSMMSLPVISSNHEHLVEKVEKYDFGVCVDPLSVDSILDGLQRIKKSDMMHLRKNARNWFLDHGSYKIHTENLINWIHERV
jgi:glycosyltransferase involved in cell wall biosynthesis